MSEFSTKLLNFYKKHGRDLPWRQNITPYKVYLSEIMLQQTTVATVIPYFEKFLHKFPTIQTLALANLEEVYHLWQGLGYYSRARNLHKCAQVIVQDFAGVFPEDEKTLLTLPGIGPYTAAAISSIAFNKKAAVVDGNVERVVSRLFNIHEPLPKSKPLIKTKAEFLLPDHDFRDYSSAIMDLGATICTPKNPKCSNCPAEKICLANTQKTAVLLPIKEPKKAKRQAHGNVFIIEDNQGKFLLTKRADTGLLANLWQFPSTGWEGVDQLEEAFKIHTEEAEMIGQIRHVFTHIDLTLDVFHLKLSEAHAAYFDRSNLPALPTLMKKALKVLETLQAGS